MIKNFIKDDSEFQIVKFALHTLAHEHLTRSDINEMGFHPDTSKQVVKEHLHEMVKRWPDSISELTLTI